MWKRLIKSVFPLLGLLLLPIALVLLQRELQHFKYDDIVRSVRALPSAKVALALLFTVLNYLVLTGYDYMGLRFIRRPLAYGKAFLASFVGFAFSNSMGFFLFSSSLVRFGLYSNWGLSTLEVASLIAFNSITFWIGLLLVGGFMMVWDPSAISLGLPLLAASLSMVGAAMLAAAGVYLFFCFWRKRPIRIRTLEVPVPSSGLALTQVVVSITDWVLAAGVLYALLPGDVSLSFTSFFGIFILAQLLGLASQVPGGLGVFETTIVLLMAPYPADQLVGTLLVYRVVYYLFPLGVAAALLSLHEVQRRRRRVMRAALYLNEWLPLVAPPAFTFLTFAAGVLLLFSGATPSVNARLAVLDPILPLSIIETSHLLAGVVGMLLIILARGLQTRLNAAYWLTLVLLGCGFFFCLLKGLAYEEATVLGVLLLALLPCRRYFHRRTRLIDERFTPAWMVTIVLALVAVAWLGIFSFKHIEYRDELWWEFALHGDAPRFLRMMIGASTVALLFAVFRLFRGTVPRPLPAGPAELDRCLPIIAHSARADANLALLGDKNLLFSGPGNAVVMYAISGRSWVAMGDPIGAESEFEELAWTYRERCDEHQGWCVFYEVSREHLPLYLDLGLIPLKIGEEARIRTAEFTLEGSQHASLRQLCRRLERDGATFSLVPQADVPALLPEFRRVSEAWLETRQTREKGFSLGVFDERYLARFPAAVVRVQGELVAFANLWLTPGKEEFSVDLMRHLPGAPAGMMDFLFTQLLQWGQAEGYAWFNLGMAPLAGLEDRPLAPRWHRFGSLVYRHGEHFYNFEGLRQYKEKFGPVWEPRYLAYPGRLNLPQVLVNVAALVSGGVKGIISK